MVYYNILGIFIIRGVGGFIIRGRGLILETRYGTVLLLDLHPGSTESPELGSFFQKGGGGACIIHMDIVMEVCMV